MYPFTFNQVQKDFTILVSSLKNSSSFVKKISMIDKEEKKEIWSTSQSQNHRESRVWADKIFIKMSELPDIRKSYLFTYIHPLTPFYLVPTLCGKEGKHPAEIQSTVNAHLSVLLKKVR